MIIEQDKQEVLYWEQARTFIEGKVISIHPKIALFQWQKAPEVAFW